MTQDSSPAPPPPPSYLSSYGPEDGPILAASSNPVMGVLTERGGFPAGTMKGPAGESNGRQLYRLCLRAAGTMKGPETELDGRWVCNGRVFERVGDAALG